MIEMLNGNNGSKKVVIPGPADLLKGDAQLGWYGETANTEIATGAELNTLLGITEGTAFNSGSPYLKFAYKGKILFVAKTPFRYGITWAHLNAKGVVFGKTVAIKGNQYIARLLTGGNQPGSTAAGGEWNDLMYRVHTADPTGTKWATYTNAQLIIDNGVSGGVTWCQENPSNSGALRICRGNGSITGYYSYSDASGSDPFAWRPVLELVQ